MACDINGLLDSGKCFAAMPTYVLDSVALELWCEISGGVTPPVEGPSLWNPDVGAGIHNPDVGAPIVNPEA